MQITLRPATPADVPQVLTFIRDLATYEREPDAVQATEADLLRDGFGPAKRFDCLIAEIAEANTTTPAGFALYFHNYSTWRGHAGIYLEDLYVSPEHRGKGIGKALLTRVAAIAVAEGCPRYEWAVLDWNQPSIDFYRSLGAVMKSEWKGMQVSGEALQALAAQSRSGAASLRTEQKTVILSGAKNPRISSEAPPITISKETN
jgi:GNAT superfamily N-acetyltransferase